jgi:transcriptional regulator with XRE-family HTH domain
MRASTATTALSLGRTAMTGLDLKIARIRANLKQYRVAAALGVSQTVLSQIENDQRVVTPERLEQIAQTIRDLALPHVSEVGGRAG